MVSHLPSRLWCPDRMESEASEGEGRHRLTSAPMASLDATSNKTGYHTATGMTSFISEMFTNRRHVAFNGSSDSSLEPAECHTFKCM